MNELKKKLKVTSSDLDRGSEIFAPPLSLKQRRALSELAAACDFPHCELGFDDPEWDEEFTRRYFEDVSRRARRSTSLLEGA